jgi:hypothetical protein
MEPYTYRLEWERWQDAASSFQKKGEGEKLVSIDWDFFYQPAKRGNFPDSLAEMMPGRVQIEEWFTRERALAHWRDLYERLQAIGFAPEDYFRYISYPSPQEFSLILQEKFAFRDVYIADSHAWGSFLSLLAAGSGKTDIISFDAHHDCGYWNYYPGDTDQRSQARARHRPSCDDWIQAAFVHNLARSAQIVYPDGGDIEWEMHPPTMPDQYLQDIAVDDFSHWLRREARKEKEKAALLLVRSSAYSPPFFSWDEDFLRLGEDLGTVTCLDCLAPGDIRIGDHDACKTRL